MTTWICPYWHKDKKDRITCEGGTVKFPDYAARMDFIARYCAGADWQGCPLARMMNDYYDSAALKKYEKSTFSQAKKTRAHACEEGTKT